MPKKREKEVKAMEEEKGQVGPGGWEIPIPEGAQFGGPPAGVYISKCTDEPKESLSSQQKPQTEFHFVIEDPDFPELAGRPGYFWCSREPKSWWVITSTLDALEVPYEINKEKKIFRFDPMECVGKYCKTVWEEREYQGRVRTRIQRVISVEETVESLEGPEEGLPF